jgi:hypothetical protein
LGDVVLFVVEHPTAIQDSGVMQIGLVKLASLSVDILILDANYDVVVVDRMNIWRKNNFSILAPLLLARKEGTMDSTGFEPPFRSFTTVLDPGGTRWPSHAPLRVGCGKNGGEYSGLSGWKIPEILHPYGKVIGSQNCSRIRIGIPLFRKWNWNTLRRVELFRRHPHDANE